MKICKVKGCGRKHSGSGYCTKHYQRYRKGTPLILNCRICKKELQDRRQKYCSNKCKNKKKSGRTLSIPTLGGLKFGGKCTVYTNGCTEELKPLVPELANKVLDDCIRNPKKYLNL